MRYFVSRSSLENEEESPCPGATLVKVEDWDIRTFQTEEEHDRKLCTFAPSTGRSDKPWRSVGTDHGFWWQAANVKGIRRRMGDGEKWTLEILDLNEFVRKHGRIILSVPDELRYGPGALWEIEIYDDYIE